MDRITAKASAFLEDVQREFDGPPPDMPEAVSKARYSDAFEDTQLFWGKTWNDLDNSEFLDSLYVFGSLPDFAVPYFLGAFMTSVVRRGDWHDAVYSIFTLPEGKKTRGLSRLTRVDPYFTTKQLELLREFLLWYSGKAPAFRDAFSRTLATIDRMISSKATNEKKNG
ncbi:MAG: hypothetical protein ACWA5A_05625 [Marinibacterium sp.]